MRLLAPRMLAASLSLLALGGCGGGSSGPTGQGSLNLRGQWQPAGQGQQAADCVGFGAEIPAEVNTLRVLFESSAGLRCCVGVNPRDAAFTGERLLVLAGLPAGPATVRLSGFASGFAPADGFTSQCGTRPAQVGRACGPGADDARYDSEARSVTIVAGRRADAGDICILSVAPPTPTVTPTSVPTDTASPRPTATHTATPVPTTTPTPTVTVPALQVGSGAGAPGTVVTVSVRLRVPGGAEVAGTDNRLSFDSNAQIVGCAVNPDIEKEGTGFSFEPDGCAPGQNCNAVRALVLSLSNTDPIADGSVLYTCEVQIADGAAAGTRPLDCSEATYSPPDGCVVCPVLDCAGGAIEVEVP